MWNVVSNNNERKSRIQIKEYRPGAKYTKNREEWGLIRHVFVAASSEVATIQPDLNRHEMAML